MNHRAKGTQVLPALGALAHGRVSVVRVLNVLRLVVLSPNPGRTGKKDVSERSQPRACWPGSAKLTLELVGRSRSAGAGRRSRSSEPVGQSRSVRAGRSETFLRAPPQSQFPKFCLRVRLQSPSAEPNSKTRPSSILVERRHIHHSGQTKNGGPSPFSRSRSQAAANNGQACGRAGSPHLVFEGVTHVAAPWCIIAIMPPMSRRRRPASFFMSMSMSMSMSVLPPEGNGSPLRRSRPVGA